MPVSSQHRSSQIERFLLPAVALFALSSPALAIGPFSREVNNLARASASTAYAPNAYGRNAAALRSAGGYRYNYSPGAYQSNFGGYGYGYGTPTYISGGFIGPGFYVPYSMTVTPTIGGAIYQGNTEMFGFGTKMNETAWVAVAAVLFVVVSFGWGLAKKEFQFDRSTIGFLPIWFAIIFVWFCMVWFLS